jgi:peptidoglycan hydrolase-like protein with peptidoglycan-binding domain
MIRDLFQGSKGEDVKNMQGMLNLHLALEVSPPLKVDGAFGPATDARVRNFQERNRLQVDGIVGLQTRRAILDFRRVTSAGAGSPSRSVSQSVSRPRFGFAAGSSGTPVGLVQSMRLMTPTTLQSVGPVLQQQTPSGNPPKRLSLNVQQGTQVNANPWSFSPLVLAAQANFFIRNDGKKPFVFSPGLQFSGNQVGSSAGPWSGQAFAQFGAAEVTDGVIDWFNPFVQVALQKNAAQPFSLGLSIGDQVNWNLIQNRLALFVNGQIATSVDLSNGRCAAPAIQILGGVSFEFVLF